MKYYQVVILCAVAVAVEWVLLSHFQPNRFYVFLAVMALPGAIWAGRIVLFFLGR